VPHADHGVRLGLSLRSRDQHRRRGHHAAAQEDRSRERAEADLHVARRGIRGAVVTVQSIRARMTVWYATALIVSIAVFSVVLHFARRSATYQDLDRRIQSEAD